MNILLFDDRNYKQNDFLLRKCCKSSKDQDVGGTALQKGSAQYAVPSLKVLLVLCKSRVPRI